MLRSWGLAALIARTLGLAKQTLQRGRGEEQFSPWPELPQNSSISSSIPPSTSERWSFVLRGSRTTGAACTRLFYCRDSGQRSKFPLHTLSLEKLSTACFHSQKIDPLTSRLSAWRLWHFCSTNLNDRGTCSVKSIQTVCFQNSEVKI